jgi:hypothetical protein
MMLWRLRRRTSVALLFKMHEYEQAVKALRRALQSRLGVVNGFEAI